eukprot:11964437-Alexandrium_andersonii.AAC.1
MRRRGSGTSIGESADLADAMGLLPFAAVFGSAEKKLELVASDRFSSRWICHQLPTWRAYVGEVGLPQSCFVHNVRPRQRVPGQADE